MIRSLLSLGVILAALASAGTAAGALSFDFTYIDDASGSFASRGWLDADSLFQRNIRAAANLWGVQFDSNATIVVDVDATTLAVRAGGTNTLGRFLYTNTDGKNVWEFGPLTRMLTGDNPGEDFYGYDILLGFDAEFVDDAYWFDPEPELRTAPVPSDKGDFVSVVLHELGHGFGMSGFRDFETGEILGNDATQFDELSYFGGNGEPLDDLGEPNPLFFAGTQAAAVYGGPMPLTHQAEGERNFSQNFYHLSACEEATDGLEGTLMNGCVLPNGERLNITPLDLAIYDDLGYPLVEATGDYNGDGAVDAADYTVWRDTLGSTTDVRADGDTDQVVDAEDYGVWKTNFGAASAGGAFVANAIPEPAGSLLLTLASWLVFGRGRRNW